MAMRLIRISVMSKYKEEVVSMVTCNGWMLVSSFPTYCRGTMSWRPWFHLTSHRTSVRCTFDAASRDAWEEGTGILTGANQTSHLCQGKLTKQKRLRSISSKMTLASHNTNAVKDPRSRKRAPILLWFLRSQFWRHSRDSWRSSMRLNLTRRRMQISAHLA